MPRKRWIMSRSGAQIEDFTAEEEAEADARVAARRREDLPRVRAEALRQVEAILEGERNQVRREIALGDDRDLIEDARAWLQELDQDPATPEPRAGTYPHLEAARDAYVDQGRPYSLEDVATLVIEAARNARGRLAELRGRETRARLALEDAGSVGEVDQVLAAMDAPRVAPA